MRSLVALVLILLLFLNVATYWQVESLQKQVAALQIHARATDNKAPDSDASMEKALALLAEARSALHRADYARARDAVKELNQRAEQIRRYAGSDSAPLVSWLRQQAHALAKEAYQK